MRNHLWAWACLLLLCGCTNTSGTGYDPEDTLTYPPRAQSMPPSDQETQSEYTPLSCLDLADQDKLALHLETLGEMPPNFGIYPQSLITYKGNFSTTDHVQTLVTLEMKLGGAAGSHDCMYALFDCPAQPQLICTAYSGGPVGKPRDLTGDGLAELITSCGHTWMGEYREHFNIHSFAGGTSKLIFEGNSYTVIDAGGNPELTHEVDDTLAIQCRHLLSDDDGDGAYELTLISEYSVHGGGATAEEMKAQLVITTDTVVVELKH